MVKRGAAVDPPAKTKKIRAEAAAPTANANQAQSPFGKGQAAHLVKVHEALTKIRGCEIFQNLSDALPLAVKDGGNQAPFCHKDFVQALASDDAVYRCAGNFLWIDHTWLCNHRVPFNQGQIKAIQKFSYPPLDPPANNPFDMHVAVDEQNFKVLEHVGSLQRVSPEEIGHAMLFSILDAIEANAPDDVLRRWRKLALTMPFAFSICAPGEYRFWKAQNLREAMVETGDTVRRTVRQRVYDVAGFKTETEKSMALALLSADKVAQLYKTHMKLARSSEPVTKSFVDSAVTIYRRVLNDQQNQSVLAWCDDNYNVKDHPFNSIYALQALCDRASTPSRIAFALEGLIDHYRMGFINAGEFTVSRLKDSRQSYICVLIMKMDARTYLLGEWLDALNIKPECKAKVRSVLASFETTRHDLSPYDDTQFTPDLSWQVGWPTSATLTVAFIEDMIYSNMFDGRFRDCIKTGSQTVDLLDYQSINERVKEIQDEISKEIADAPAAGSSGTLPSAVTTPPTLQGTGDATACPSGQVSGTAVQEGFDCLEADDQTFWLKSMKKLINTYSARIPDSGSTGDLTSKIQACPMAMMRGDPTGLVLYHFDVKKYGESITRPDLRITPLRDAPYVRLVTTVLQARAVSADAATASGDDENPFKAPLSLATGELAIILDGGKRGNAARLLAPWRGATPKGSKQKDEDDVDDEDEEETAAKQGIVPSLMQLVFSSASLVARKKLARLGTLSLKQVEWAHIAANSRISLPERAWKHHPGTNCGDALVGIDLPLIDSDSVWKMEWRHKKTLYGKKHFIAVGGKTEGAEKSSGGVINKRTDDSIEPVCYHPFPATFYEDILHGFFVKLVYDLTPADDTLTWVCLQQRVACISVCYTDAHAELLHDRLLQRLKVAMGDVSSKLYNAAYAVAIGKKTLPTPAAAAAAKACGGKPKAKPKPPAGPKAAGKSKAKAKAAKAACDDVSEPEDVAEDEDDDEVWDPLAN